MRAIVVLGLIGLVGWALLRSLREQRRSWIERLALVGTWQGSQDGVRYRLRLEGNADGGRYREEERGAQGTRVETGRWRLEGHTLEFTPDEGAASACDLRLFDTGRIGLHGPGRSRRVYERETDNVIPLPRR